jgi:endonuclease YncB( thermonuclease family)
MPPERRQTFGRKAKEMLSALVFGRTVRVVEVDRDRWGRVYRGDLDVNAEMVRQGMAWVYRKYTHDRELYRIEDDA